MRLLLTGLALCNTFAAADAHSLMRPLSALPQSPIRNAQATSLCAAPQPPDKGECKAICICANHVSNCAWVMSCP